LPEDDRLKFSPSEDLPPVVAQFNAELGDWEILVQDQWVSLSHIIDALIEMRTILQQQVGNHLP